METKWKPHFHLVLWIAMVTCLFPSLAMAGGDVTVTHARLRLVAEGMPAAGFFNITNNAGKAVTLVAIKGPAFRRIVLLKNDSAGKPVVAPTLELAPGQRVEFSDDGYRLKMWLLEPLRHKATTPVTLEFSDGHSVNVTFRIGGPAEG